MADKSNGHISRERKCTKNVGMFSEEKMNVNVRSDNPQQKEKKNRVKSEKK